MANLLKTSTAEGKRHQLLITFSWKAILHSHGATASTRSVWESAVESRIAAPERILNDMHGMLQLANPASASNPASDTVVYESLGERSASREPIASRHTNRALRHGLVNDH